MFKFVTVCLLTTGFVVLSSCGKENVSKVDSVSMATPKGVTVESVKNDLPPASDAYHVYASVDGIKNYVVKYDDNYYRGGDLLSESGAKNLKEMFGIKTIISVTPNNLEKRIAQEYGLGLVEFEFTNKGFDLETLNKYLTILDENQGPFYVHCHGGTHRAGSLGAAYRIHKLGWDQDKALVEFGRLGGDLKADNDLVESILLKN